MDSSQSKKRKSIKGDVWLDMLYLEKIPDIFQDVEVRGDFICRYNRLASLKGAPEYVGGSFFCGYNQLSSLEGIPEYVGGNFWCYGNAVKFTEEQVRAVCQVKGDVYV